MATVGKTLQGADASTLAIVEVGKAKLRPCRTSGKNCLRRGKESLQVTN